MPIVATGFCCRDQDHRRALQSLRQIATSRPSRYILAANTPELDALMVTFADNALVNDQLCEHWGKGSYQRVGSP